MYTALILVLLGIAAFFIVQGAKKQKNVWIAIGIIIGLLTAFLFWFMGFWGEVLWFENLGYGDRYWTVIYLNTVTAIGGAAIGFVVVFFLTKKVPKKKILSKYGSRALAAFVGGAWGVSNWGTILKYFNKVSNSLTDPILHHTISFYLFTLPFLDQLYSLLFMLTLISLIAALTSSYFYISENGLEILTPSPESINNLYINTAVFVFVLTLGKFLARYHIMYSTTGVVAGPGWTDVNILLPAYDVIIVLMIFVGVFILIPSLRKKLQYFFAKRSVRPEGTHALVLVSLGGFVLAIWFIGLSVLPGIFEWLVVQPNEITYERPYITNNIKFTRYGFGLNKIEEKQYPENGTLTRDVVNDNPNIFSNIRLWDWRALDAVYKQFQEFRLYYEFSDVDVDRYKFDSTYRQVMVSAREMNSSNLPEQSQTFINKRFQYTHGYGITMATVNEFTPQDLPHLLIKNIPPVSEYPQLDVKRPEIYYGELTNSSVIVNTKEKEFDYPSGEQNVYTKYAGKGGVQLSNLWRKFLYGWKFDGTKLLFSDYPTRDSRIMFHRQILDRISTLAPFLHFDNDPYIILADGKLYWIIDAYTASDYFPYSQPFNSTENIEYNDGNTKRTLTDEIAENLDGMNYVRNSVKVVVNAYNGNVNFYIMDESDPIVKVWSKIFPGLFKTKDEMPKDIYQHIRYPKDYLLVQGRMYEKYHMSDPTVFYNQEDLWVRATEKYYNQVQPVQPYYIMWQLPGSNKPQFSLILPFTPKNRQVLIGWIAGLCDPPDYGKFFAYQFPKDQTVLGPQQVETKIDQDSFLSGQLTLWDQRGSNVIRGNVLAIPVNNTIFYVEPIYLQAETAAYPELRLVIVMHGDDLSYANNFAQALNGLFSQNPQVNPVKQSLIQEKASIEQNVDQANEAFNNYLKLLGEKKFSEAAKELEKLQKNLNDLSSQEKMKK
jgi:uncharacterized protein